MKCPKCNNIVPDGSMFCNHCGHKFEQENTIMCPNPECGHLIPADSNFCPDCGYRLGEIYYMNSCKDVYVYSPHGTDKFFEWISAFMRELGMEHSFSYNGDALELLFKRGKMVIKMTASKEIIKENMIIILSMKEWNESKIINGGENLYLSLLVKSIRQVENQPNNILFVIDTSEEDDGDLEALMRSELETLRVDRNNIEICSTDILPKKNFDLSDKFDLLPIMASFNDDGIFSLK